MSQTKVIMIVLNDVKNDSRVKKMARTLGNHGFSVTIFGFSRLNSNEPTIEKIGKDVELRIFPDPRKHIAKGSLPGDRWKLLICGLISEMWPHFERMGPDIVHTHDFGSIRIGGELVKRIRMRGDGVYWIHDAHEYVYGLEQMDGSVLVEAISDHEEFIRIPQKIITVSKPISGALTEDHLLPELPTTILNCPRNPGKFSKRGVKGSLGLPDGTPLIVYSGGLAKQRGVELVVSSLKTLEFYHLCIVTDLNSKYLQNILDLADKIGVSERVHIQGYVDYEEVPSYLSDADIAVHPMLRYKNGDLALPNKLFDYLHARLPIIVSDCETMAGFVEKHNLGAAFESGNISSLIAAIEGIKERDKGNDQIMEDLILKYSWEEQEKILLDIYSVAR